MIGRLKKAADGAALATETTAKVTLLASTREPLYNEALSKVVQRHLERVGAAEVGRGRRGAREGDPEGGRDPRDRTRARGPAVGAGRGASASSDIGEVSAAFPLAELGVADGPSGAPWHHWDVASCAASPVGVKGMLVAAKVLAASTTDLLKDAGTIAAAKAEFQKTTGGKPYVSPLAPDADAEDLLTAQAAAREPSGRDSRGVRLEELLDGVEERLRALEARDAAAQLRPFGRPCVYQP